MKKIIIIAVLFILILIVSIYSLTISMSGDSIVIPEVKTTKLKSFNQRGGTTIKLMSLNLAHGRLKGPNQVFQSDRNIDANLDVIASVINREKPDVLALQESDENSIFTGEKNQVALIANKSGLEYYVQGEHVKSKKMTYGTALLSNYKLTQPLSVTFKPSPPTFSKGFVKSTMTWPGLDAEIDVISVHLDFARSSVRKNQINEMIKLLKSNENPIVVLGDFNSDWKDESSAVKILASQLNLTTYQAESNKLNTFPILNKRLDWVLVSKEIDITSFQVLDDVISDHLAIVCEIRLK